MCRDKEQRPCPSTLSWGGVRWVRDNLISTVCGKTKNKHTPQQKANNEEIIYRDKSHDGADGFRTRSQPQTSSCTVEARTGDRGCKWNLEWPCQGWWWPQCTQNWQANSDLASFPTQPGLGTPLKLFPISLGAIEQRYFLGLLKRGCLFRKSTWDIHSFEPCKKKSWVCGQVPPGQEGKEARATGLKEHSYLGVAGIVTQFLGTRK